MTDHEIEAPEAPCELLKMGANPLRARMLLAIIENAGGRS
jgi:hypothetical protein